MSKNPPVRAVLTFGTCLGCDNTRSVLMKCFGGSCSEKCQRRVERRIEREAEKAALAAVQAKAEAAKEAAEVADWAARLRKEYERMGRTFAPLPATPREARASLLRREKFLAEQRAAEVGRERKLRGR